MDYPDYLQPVLERINPEYGVNIYCDEGWWNLIALCDKELALIDPLYTVFQIKEKFGGLRYYYNPSNPSQRDKMDTVVRKYEKVCSMTCEKTGKHGYLMINGWGHMKTLGNEFLNNGWSMRRITASVDLDEKQQGQ
jgi:hypothetical protein